MRFWLLCRISQSDPVDQDASGMRSVPFSAISLCKWRYRRSRRCRPYRGRREAVRCGRQIFRTDLRGIRTLTARHRNGRKTRHGSRRSQSKPDQRSGSNLTGSIKLMVSLKPPQRVCGIGVPHTGGYRFEIPLCHERLLDLTVAVRCRGQLTLTCVC